MATGSSITPAIIATWPVPNYVNPESQKSSIDAAIYATTITMLFFVAARVFVRLNQSSGMKIDDWTMVAAAIFSVAIGANLLVLTQHALGRHLYDVEFRWLVNFAKMNLSAVALYTFCITFAKSSVCMTYLHLFPSRTNKIFCWTMITYQILWSTITTVLYVLQCIPIDSLWDPTVPAKMCLDSHLLLTMHAALNVVSDFIIFLWPIMPLWQIQLPLAQRLHLITVFAFGVFTCVGGILKAVWVQEYFKTWDTTWVASKATIALCIEYNVGIMSGCLPCLRPLMAMIAPKYFVRSTTAGHDYPANSGGASWHKSPLRTKNSNSVKLDSEPTNYAETYEFTNTKITTGARTWVARGNEVSQAEGAPSAGIRVTKDMKVYHGNPEAGRMTGDATSEEWIMKEDSLKSSD